MPLKNAMHELLLYIVYFKTKQSWKVFETFLLGTT